MHASAIKVGGLYEAKVSGNLTVVRVERFGDTHGYNLKGYTVVNTKTGRRAYFKTAGKFRKAVVSA